jgi:hypothetical protein
MASELVGWLVKHPTGPRTRGLTSRVSATSVTVLKSRGPTMFEVLRGPLLYSYVATTTTTTGLRGTRKRGPGVLRAVKTWRKVDVQSSWARVGPGLRRGCSLGIHLHLLGAELLPGRDICPSSHRGGGVPEEGVGHCCKCLGSPGVVNLGDVIHRKAAKGWQRWRAVCL